MMPRKLSRRVLTISVIVISLCPLVYSRPQVGIESPQDESHTSRPGSVEKIDAISVTGSDGIRYNTSFKYFGLNYSDDYDEVSSEATPSNIGEKNYEKIHTEELILVKGESRPSKVSRNARIKRNSNSVLYTDGTKRLHYKIDKPFEMIANAKHEYDIQKNYGSDEYNTRDEEDTFVSSLRDNKRDSTVKYDHVAKQNRAIGNHYTRNPIIITRQKNSQRLNFPNSHDTMKQDNSINSERMETLTHTQLDSLQRLQKRLRPYKNNIINSDSFTHPHSSNNLLSQNEEKKLLMNHRKPIIRKVFTHWTDSTNFDDVHKNITSKNSSYEHDLENKYSEIFIRPKPYAVPRPQTVASSGTHVFSNNIQVVDEFDVHGKPTPLVAYARPSKPNNPPGVFTSYPTIIRRPSTSVPMHAVTSPFKYPSFHNSINHLYPISSTVSPFDSFKPEVAESHTTYPISTFTDTVVIKPFDYNASPNKCPTITLKLNNTIKSKSQEICPDVNIAINTQVVNEHVMVDDSEELDSEEGDDEDEYSFAHLNDSDESNKGSESNENSVEDSTEESAFFSNSPSSLTSDSEVENFSDDGSSSGIASGSQLAHSVAETDDNDDDEEESFMDTWMGPATNMMNWLAILNPFNYGVWSLVLAPLAVVLAGGSGLSALLAPWGIPYARSVLKDEVRNGHHKWFWDSSHNSWNWNDSTGDKNWRIVDPRSLPENNVSNVMENKAGGLMRKIKIWVIEAIADTISKTLGIYSNRSDGNDSTGRKQEKWKTKRRRK